jgi:hypothetical protein
MLDFCTFLDILRTYYLLVKATGKYSNCLKYKAVKAVDILRSPSPVSTLSLYVLCGNGQERVKNNTSWAHMPEVRATLT